MVIVFVNQKGGVGKTTFAFNTIKLAKGLKVLAIDFDIQGNLSQMLTGDFTINTKKEGAETLFTTPVITEISPTLHLMHGHKYLECIDNTETLIKAKSINLKAMFPEYDLIIIDTPPALGARQVMPLFWADKVVIPLEASDLSLLGLVSINQTLNQVKKVNHKLTKQVFINRFIKTKKQMEVIDKLSAKTEISGIVPNRTAIADSMSAGVGAFEYAGAKKDLKVQLKNIFELTIKQ